MSPKGKKSTNNNQHIVHDDEHLILNNDNQNALQLHQDHFAGTDMKQRELSITSELLYGVSNRDNKSMEPTDRTPSISGSVGVGRGFSIVNSNSNMPPKERRKSINKSKSMKIMNSNEFTNSSAASRRPSENLEPFQFKHPFGGQPNTFIKNTNSKISKKDSMAQPRSNSISSLLGAAAMMNPDSKRNSVVSLNFNDIEKAISNNNNNNTSTMKPPKKLPMGKQQSQNPHDVMDIHKAPSMSEFDFFNSGRKDSFKAPSFIPQSLNDLDSDLFLNRKNSNVRGSGFDNGARFSRTFSSGMQQFLNQNFGAQLGSDNNPSNSNNNNTNNNNINNNITHHPQHPQRRRESSIGASHFTDFIKGNENAISDDEDDDHHNQVLRNMHNNNNGEEMSAEDMRQLAAAAALAGGVPLSQLQGKQSFRSSFAGGVSLQNLLQYDNNNNNNNPTGNSRMLRRSIRANSNTPIPLGTPPLHAFGGSFNMMNMGMNVAVTSDEEDHHGFHDFEGFSQVGGSSGRDQSFNFGQSVSANASNKKAKAKKRVAKPKNNQNNLKKLNKQAADAAFEAAAHATSLATMNKQDKESPATKRRGKKLENKPLSNNNNTNGFMNSTTATLTLNVNNNNSKRDNTKKSANNNNNKNSNPHTIVTENKRFIGDAMISEFDSLNGNFAGKNEIRATFGRKLKPSDFLTTTLTTSMEPATKPSSGNRRGATSGGKGKKTTVETKKKVVKPKTTRQRQNAITSVQITPENDSISKMNNATGLDETSAAEAAAAAALQVIAKSESPVPPQPMPTKETAVKMTKTLDTPSSPSVAISGTSSNTENVSTQQTVKQTGKTSAKNSPRTTATTASSKPKKQATVKPKPTPPVKHTPMLLAEPIRVANPIIPQINQARIIDSSMSTSVISGGNSGSGSINDPTTNDEEEKKPNVNNENVAVLGATNVDQLMLILQARQKGFQQQLKKTSDGKLDIFSTPDIIPPAVELVGGVDKPKVLEDYEQSINQQHSHSHAPHGGRKMYVCQYCHKQFSQTTHLEVHVRSHVGLKPYTCEHCGKSFTQGGNLRTHIRLHTGEQPFSCKVCDKKFSRKGNLQAHMLTHDNLKPFACQLDNCDKGFTQLGNLKSHQNKFHLETLNSLTLKLAEGLTGKETAEELKALDYLGGLYKNSNRGIKGRGKKT
ncbi:hypothetical protein ACO0SA_001505 [Hanseniaspora valbyensis]